MKVTNETPLEFFSLPGNGPADSRVLTVVVKGTFRIQGDGPPVLAPEQDPIIFGDMLQDPETGGSTIFEDDLASFKPRADVVVIGKAFAPKGCSVHALDVGFRVGQLKKVIRVIGNRHWRSGGLLGGITASEPEPFAEMDLIYENAFGGMDMKWGDYCAENPVGRGIFGSKAKKEDVDKKPLPNIEDPNNLIKSWKDRPTPIGFGFIGKGWAQRLPFLGTYDKKWKKERYPERPLDFKFDYFNAAPPDQQIEGYLKGDEEVELFHLTRDGRTKFQLSGKPPVISVSRSFEGSTFESVQVNLDTLCLMPAQERFYLVWRGLVPIENLDAPDVARIEISM